MSDDRVDGIQRGLEIFGRLMRPPLLDADDPVSARRMPGRAAELGAELADLGLSRAELEDVQLLYFQGHDAGRDLESEHFAKLAYLVKHSPGARSMAEARRRLSAEQWAEYNAITAAGLTEGEDR